MQRLTKRIKRLERLAKCIKHRPLYHQFRNDPLAYIEQVLGVQPTDGWREVIKALMAPPRRVLVSSGHSVGKTMLAACLVNWFYDTRDPGLVLTTAPTERQVVDLLWKEVRLLRDKNDQLSSDWVGPKIPRLQSSPNHFAHGFTAREATAFQGHHCPGGLLIIFDEAEGVDVGFWQTMKSMLDDESFFFAGYNPTTIGSAAHLAEQVADQFGEFRKVTISCLDHPNIAAQLRHQPIPIQGAITLGQLESMLLEDSMILSDTDETQVGDVHLNGRHYRPGPVAEARCLGRRPTQATTGIWYEQLWQRVLQTHFDINPQWPVAVGCDVARYGDDQTVIMVRKGWCLLHVETHIKQSTSWVARRLREVCTQFADESNTARQIPCMIDEGGIGGGVIDQAEGYCFVPVNAACRPRRDDRYLNVRAELWFNAREVATQGALDVSRLSSVVLSRLKQELMVAKYQIVAKTGKIQVEAKDAMKQLLKRSPDLADAFCLCVYPVR